jgi:hypothetical protein
MTLRLTEKSRRTESSRFPGAIHSISRKIREALDRDRGSQASDGLCPPVAGGCGLKPSPARRYLDLIEGPNPGEEMQAFVQFRDDEPDFFFPRKGIISSISAKL